MFPGPPRDSFYDDPFLEQPGSGRSIGSPGAGPYGTPPVYGRFGGRVGISGINGPQPFRWGWQPRFDVGYLPARSVSRGDGKFGIFAFDGEIRNNRPLPNGSVFSYAPQFGLRTWDGPMLAGGGTLPSAVYRLGTDLEYSTTAAGPWSVTLGFNPSLNTDFARTPTSNAYNLDARAMLFYRASAQWMYVLGVGYLDRVHNWILPYSGVVWTPNDRTEFRLLFPESRISHYIGNYFSDDKWIYASAGFHVEAYQIEIERYGPQPGRSNRTQRLAGRARPAVGERLHLLVHRRRDRVPPAGGFLAHARLRHLQRLAPPRRPAILTGSTIG